MPRDFYEVLGVDKKADKKAIEKACVPPLSVCALPPHRTHRRAIIDDGLQLQEVAWQGSKRPARSTRLCARRHIEDACEKACKREHVLQACGGMLCREPGCLSV